MGVLEKYGQDDEEEAAQPAIARPSVLDKYAEPDDEPAAQPQRSLRGALNLGPASAPPRANPFTRMPVSFDRPPNTDSLPQGFNPGASLAEPPGTIERGFRANAEKLASVPQGIAESIGQHPIAAGVGGALGMIGGPAASAGGAMLGASLAGLPEAYREGGARGVAAGVVDPGGATTQAADIASRDLPWNQKVKLAWEGGLPASAAITGAGALGVAHGAGAIAGPAGRVLDAAGAGGSALLSELGGAKLRRVGAAIGERWRDSGNLARANEGAPGGVRPGEVARSSPPVIPLRDRIPELPPTPDQFNLPQPGGLRYEDQPRPEQPVLPLRNAIPTLPSTLSEQQPGGLRYGDQPRPVQPALPLRALVPDRGSPQPQGPGGVQPGEGPRPLQPSLPLKSALPDRGLPTQAPGGVWTGEGPQPLQPALPLRNILPQGGPAPLIPKLPAGPVRLPGTPMRGVPLEDQIAHSVRDMSGQVYGGAGINPQEGELAARVIRRKQVPGDVETMMSRPDLQRVSGKLSQYLEATKNDPRLKVIGSRDPLQYVPKDYRGIQTEGDAIAAAQHQGLSDAIRAGLGEDVNAIRSPHLHVGAEGATPGEASIVSGGLSHMSSVAPEILGKQAIRDALAEKLPTPKKTPKGAKK